MAEHNGNGNATIRKIVWGILGLLGTIFTALASAWAQSVHEDLQTVRGHAERLGRLETNQANLDRRFDRMEEKLDRILENTRRKERE